MPRMLTLAATCLVAACTRSAPPPALVERDSAGVRIVETNVPVWRDSARWKVDSAPVVTIGNAAADSDAIGFVVGAVRLDDGSIVIADRDKDQLRLYDSTGHFVRAAGRKGQGPGEFRGLEGLARCGSDELWADIAPRISVWGTDLLFRREFTVTDDVMWPLICFAGHGLLVKHDIDVGEPVNTIFFDSLRLMVVDSTGNSRRDLMSIPLWQYMNLPAQHLGLPHPFGRVTQLAADGPNIDVGLAADLDVRTYTMDGRLLRIARGPRGGSPHHRRDAPGLSRRAARHLGEADPRRTRKGREPDAGVGPGLHGADRRR